MPELRAPKPRPPALKLDEVDEAAGVTVRDPSQTSAIADLVPAGDMSSDGGDFSNTDSDEEDDVMIEPKVNRPLALSRGISVDLQLQTTTSLMRRASVSGAPPNTPCKAHLSWVQSNTCCCPALDGLCPASIPRGAVANRAAVLVQGTCMRCRLRSRRRPHSVCPRTMTVRSPPKTTATRTE